MKKRTKFLFLRASVLLAFAILAGRLWYVQVVMSSYYKAQGDTSKIRDIPIMANRGIIYDRSGTQLVWNSPSWAIEIVPHGLPNHGVRQMYTLLSRLMHGTPPEQKISQLVRTGLAQPYQPVVIKANASSDVAMVVLQYHNRLPGVRVSATSIRHYREDGARNSVSHIVGYAQTIDPATYQQYRRLYPGEHATINDLAGRDGVELQYDPYMHGVNGNEQVEVDAGERPVRVLRSGGTVPGDSVYLTINWKLQKQVSADLEAALAKYNLRQGVAVVENVRTGEILAMVSLPSYNNNWFSPGISNARYQSLSHDPATPLNNLAISGQYPPGSTFKLITAAAALGTGVVTPSTQYDDTGKITLPGGQVYNGWQPGGLGMMNLVSAVEESSDIYFYTVAGGDPNLHPDPPHIGANRLAHYAHLYGLGQYSGIDLPNEQKGFIPSATWFDNLPPTRYLKNKGDVWTIGYTYNMAIGQGQDLATPLQVANYTSMVANGGTLYQPKIVDKIEGRIVPGEEGASALVGRAGFRPDDHSTELHPGLDGRADPAGHVPGYAQRGDRNELRSVRPAISPPLARLVLQKSWGRRRMPGGRDSRRLTTRRSR